VCTCAVFLSVFKWEARKGWKDLVRGFCDAFKPNDNVVLWILTKSFMDSGEVRSWPDGELLLAAAHAFAAAHAKSNAC
jgi:hypothetical protein